MTPIRIGTPPYSSNDPNTEGNRMVPINHGGPSAMNSDGSAADPNREASGKYEEATVSELAELAHARGLEVEGTGKSGAKVKDDYIAALEDDDEKSSGNDDTDQT